MSDSLFGRKLGRGKKPVSTQFLFNSRDLLRDAILIFFCNRFVALNGADSLIAFGGVNKDDASWKRCFSDLIYWYLIWFDLN